MQSLARDENFEITLHRCRDPKTNKLAITFGGQPSDLSSRGFGTDFLLSLGLDTIYVAQKFGTQYQGCSIDQFRDSVLPLAGEWDDVICYGSSLGGYAALYYGGVVNARIIAAAPMLPAWPPLKLPAYVDHPITHSELKDVPLSIHDPTVFYDPMVARDKFLVENMVEAAYPKFRAVPIPFAGHTVLVTLSQARLLRPIIENLILNDELIAFEPPAEGTAIWHGEKGSHLIKSDPTAAKAHLKRSLEIRPSRRIFNQLIQCLINLGQLEEAQAELDLAKECGDKNFTLFPSRAKKVIEAGLVA